MKHSTTSLSRNTLLVSEPLRPARTLQGSNANYRATFTNALKGATNLVCSDEIWLSSLAGFLLNWFAGERDFLHPSAKTLLQVMLERDLFTEEQLSELYLQQMKDDK